MLPDGGGYGYHWEAAGHTVGILHTSRGARVPDVLNPGYDVFTLPSDETD